jgi:IS5 family transposase
MRGSDEFFHSRIDQMIDLRHPLAVLASNMPWQPLGSGTCQPVLSQ